MAKKILLALALTIVVGVVLVGFINLFERTSYDVLILIFILPCMLGIINVVFLLFIYLLKFGREYLLEFKYMVIEITLFYAISFLVHKAIDLIPLEHKYDITPKLTSLKFYFQPMFKFLYVFFVLAIILIVIKRLWINHDLSHRTDDTIDRLP